MMEMNAGDDLDGDDRRDRPIDHKTERRPPASVGNKLAAVLPEVLGERTIYEVAPQTSWGIHPWASLSFTFHAPHSRSQPKRDQYGLPPFSWRPTCGSSGPSSWLPGVASLGNKGFSV